MFKIWTSKWWKIPRVGPGWVIKNGPVVVYRRQQPYSRGSTCCPIICAEPAPNVKAAHIWNRIKYKSSWINELQVIHIAVTKRSLWEPVASTRFHSGQPYTHQRLIGPGPIATGHKLYKHGKIIFRNKNAEWLRFTRKNWSRFAFMV